jgi:hypothetical protein
MMMRYGANAQSVARCQGNAIGLGHRDATVIILAPQYPQ